MFSSLRFRLWLTYALVVGVVLVIAGAAVIFYLLRNPAIDRREVQRLRLVANLMVQRNQAVAAMLRNPSSENIDQALQRLVGTGHPCQMFVWDHQGCGGCHGWTMECTP